jgi:hypothetical protein
MALPKIVAAIVSEEIRKEASGKFTVTGAYASDIRIQSLPGFLPIAVLAELHLPTPADFKGTIEVLDPHSNPILTGEFGGQFPVAGNAAMAIGPLPLSLQEAGTYVLRWRETDRASPWETIKSFNVVLDPTIVGEPRQLIVAVPVSEHP